MGSSPFQTNSELNAAIERLLEAREAAERAPNQDMLVKLIDAVLLHAGRELAKVIGSGGPRLDGDEVE